MRDINNGFVNILQKRIRTSPLDRQMADAAFEFRIADDTVLKSHIDDDI